MFTAFKATEMGVTIFNVKLTIKFNRVTVSIFPLLIWLQTTNFNSKMYSYTVLKTVILRTGLENSNK